MKKKDLLLLPRLKATMAMMRAAEEDKGHEVHRYNGMPIWVPDYLWYYRARKTGEALEVAIYTREMLMEGNRYPRYRVFLHDGKYDTWDEAKEKWRSSTIERLEYLCPGGEWKKYMLYAERFVWMTDREHRILAEYVKNGKECPRAAVQYWQDYKKNRQELDRIDEEMSLVPRLPRGFDRWSEKEAMPQYIFYDAGRKVEKGYCTHCEREVPIREPRYNRQGTCPHCKHEITYKSRKKAGNIVDRGHAGILQKTGEGYVYRYFETRIKYENGVKDEGGFQKWELIRQTYDREFRERNEFEHARYKQTDMIRWCYKNYSVWNEKVVEHPAMLYPKNLKKVMDGGRMRYSAIEIFARHAGKFYPENYITEYRRKPCIEQLVKCGFYDIVKALISGRDIRHLNLKRRSCREILGLNGWYYRMLAGTNPTVEEYRVTHEMQEIGIQPKREDVRFLANLCERDFAIYIRHTTPHKMLKYLKENLDGSRERAREYHDYLQMAACLGYNLDSEFILYPRNLQERHQQYVEEKREKDAEIQKMDDESKQEQFAETIASRGWKGYEMEDEGMLIRLPRSVGEIREEGHALHHCVAGYINRMLAGETCILFIRRKDAPEKQYYTIEVREGKIMQCRGKNNREMTNEVKEFVSLFRIKKLSKTIERKAG